MGAIAYASGPAAIYVARVAPGSTPSTSQLYFLGTGERPPTLQLNPQWEPIMNDSGGSILPIMYSFQGEDGLVNIVLNKWNEYVYRLIAAHAVPSGATLGSTLWSDIGAIDQLESMTWQYYVHFPYATAKSSIYGSTNHYLPTCYHFVACRLASHTIMPGTTQNRRGVTVHCDRFLAETASSSTSGFVLFDNTLGNVPAVPPIIGGTGQVSLG